ncbi:recombinase family protein [Paenibacillus rhizophilus]|uniref:Recombinase family protein n=1 Tax=Paenibacillus rhizophilus TaxID=1850366 RepID=A0A3N9P148_9BACL|nr:recombinase family protein [Paenibacillus rhizophilus]RQW08854.1 hypothetical protein EH198_20900 [Paenibacillus rhizophilus]
MFLSGSRAAEYRRVSLERQATHGFSLQGQHEAISKMCDASRIPLVADYVDAGISGKDATNRPGVDKMLRDAERGHFDVLVVWSISRLARNFLDLLNIVEHLRHCGVRLYSLSERFDSETIQGRLMMQVHGIFAEFQRSVIAENVSLTMNRKSRRGDWNAGNNVWGYRLSSNPLDPKGTIVIVPEEADWVRRVFKWYAEDSLGYKAIASRLNREGLNTVNGKRFSVASIRNILRNRNYLGEVKYREWPDPSGQKTTAFGWTQGPQPPLIEPALWDKVQASLQKRSAIPSKQIQRPFPLVGVLKCPSCGKGMIPGHTKSPRKDGTFRVNFYYVCGTYNNQGAGTCKRNAVLADAIEDWFFKRLHVALEGTLAFEPLSRAVQDRLDHRTQPLRRELLQVSHSLADTETEIRKQMLSFESGELDAATLSESSGRLKAHLLQFRQEKERLETEMAEAQRQRISDKQIREALAVLRSLLQDQPPGRQQELIRLLVERIDLVSNRNFSQAVIHGSPALFQIPISEEVL